MKHSFKSNRSDFNHKHRSFMDMALGRMAMALEVFLKTTAGMPVLYGNMKSQTRHFKNDNGTWRTEVDAAYAAVQEAGIRKSGKGAPAVIEHYTTAGTGKGFFARAISSLIKNREQYIMEARRANDL